MRDMYDFIVVGSGPAGSAVAAGLARSAEKPSVLLLEAGGPNADRDLRVDGQRWTTFMRNNMNWGYKTTPQEHCNRRVIDYSRGKGLGGCSAINFGVYSVGAKDDYDRWARLVGDDDFGWDHMHVRHRRLETFHGDLPAGIGTKYAAPKPDDHGHSGPLPVGYAAEWEHDLPHVLDVFETAGFPLSPDHNSGNPLGMSITINSAHGGLRSTAQDLYTPKPKNLDIRTDCYIHRLILEGNRVVGVKTETEHFRATKEVILSAGSLNTPSILMHSGIGPADQLQKYGIPLVLDAPAVGQGLRDHEFIPVVYEKSGEHVPRIDFYSSQEAMDDALEQWKKDSTGPWSKFGCSVSAGWFKLEGVTTSKEFQELPHEEQAFLQRPTIPHYEILSHFPLHWIKPELTTKNYVCLSIFLYNSQSRGEVTLQSSDPATPLLINPRFLASPFDRRVAVEALRDALRLASHPAYMEDTAAMLEGPVSESDADLLEYWRENVISSWHMSGTAKMGKHGDNNAVVDNNFKVRGIQGLRIADMSVVPVSPSCHVQAVAYATGMTCADKLVIEYGLDDIDF